MRVSQFVILVCLLILSFIEVALTQEFVAGEIYESTFVEYRAGNLPIVISVPHGGLLEPDSIPDRDCIGCVTVMDAFTKVIGESWYDAIITETGCYPHVIINTLHRKKFDANRDIEDAADGQPLIEEAWRTYHQFIDSAKARVVLEFGKGLFLDLHGHGHTIQRTELGYLLSKSELQMDDAALNASNLIEESSLKTLVETNKNMLSHAELIRGSTSLGSLLEEEGFPCVPSSNDLFPLNAESYFSGGYNTVRHGSRDDNGVIDAIQIELNQDARFTEDAREALVAALTKSVLSYLESHYFRGFSEGYCDFVSHNDPAAYQTVENPFYPNPTYGPIWIEASAQISRLEIYNVTGKLVQLHSGNIPYLDLSSLSDGTYIIKYFSNEQPVYIGRIVKM